MKFQPVKKFVNFIYFMITILYFVFFNPVAISQSHEKQLTLNVLLLIYYLNFPIFIVSVSPVEF